MMRLSLFGALFLAAGIVALALSKANASEQPLLGQGKNTCNEYITVVDGNWSHPLNALHFHGYISWAQGLLSGHNQFSDQAPISINTDELKLSLVDYCRDNPEASFADAVSSLIP